MRSSESLHSIVEQHQFVATVVMVLTNGLSAYRVWRWQQLTGTRRWMYVGSLGATCALLGFTGYWGGSLVFGPDHLGW